jgi:uncharacterized metal-binding protein YceD (DUF177 family)
MEKTGRPDPGRLWSVPVAVEDIPDTGLHIEIEAPAATRAQMVDLMAELAVVRDLPQLSAVFDLTPEGAGVHVAGRLSARVGQTCVVTLEPIESVVEEAIDLHFVPGSAAAAQPGPESGGPGDQEPAEPLVDGKVDLGVIATESLILAIDPYPRKPDAEFSPPKVADDGVHPFAALQALKKLPGGGAS